MNGETRRVKGKMARKGEDRKGLGEEGAREMRPPYAEYYGGAEEEEEEEKVS